MGRLMSGPTQDLNEVITSAVQARIEAEVMKALSGDEVFGQFVTAALRQPVEKERYSREKVTWLAKVLEEAVKDAARQAVHRVVAEMTPALEAEVAKQIRRDTKGIAAGLVAGVVGATAAPYGVTITLKERSAGD